MRLCCSRDVGIHLQHLLSKICAALYFYAFSIRQTENKVDNKSNAEIFPTHPSADRPSRILHRYQQNEWAVIRAFTCITPGVFGSLYSVLTRLNRPSES